MKEFSFLSAIIVCVLCSCGDDDNKPKGDSFPDSEKYECIIPPPDTTLLEVERGMPVLTHECYRFDKGEQHKWIEIAYYTLDSVWGTLHYQWDGKDGANGEFSGEFHGDTLWVIFYAKGEGQTHIREVAFLEKDGKLYEAQGTQEENSKGVYYYQHKKKLEFSDPEPMVKGPCM